MPKTALNFQIGATADAEHSIANMPSTNLYPVIDRSTGKTMVKAPVIPEVGSYFDGGVIAGVIQAYTDTSGLFTTVYILVTRNSGNVFEVAMWRMLGGTPSLMDTISVLDITAGNTGSYSMATNGLNIVCVKRGFNKSTTDDFVYDISSQTLSQLDDEANYSSFGKAVDVTYMNERYFFIALKNIFAGGTRTGGSDGLDFNAAAFALNPSPSNAGTAIAAVNGSIYVYTSSKTYLYSDVGTSPFPLQRSTTVDLDVGCVGAGAKVIVGNIIYSVAYNSSGSASLYAISGTGYTEVGDSDLLAELYPSTGSTSDDNVIAPGTVLAYANDENLGFIQIFNENPIDSETKFYVYDIKTGASHIRGSDNSGNYPAYFYGSMNQSITANLNYVFGYANDEPVVSSVTTGNSDYCYLDDFDPGNYSFTYYLTFFRDEAEPFVLRSVRLSVANCSAVELSVSEDGDSYTSLGTLSTLNKDNGSAIVEWRRINRKLAQAMAKITLTQSDTMKRPAILSGSVMV